MKTSDTGATQGKYEISPQDTLALQEKNIDLKTYAYQIEGLSKGFSFAHLVESACIGKGIKLLSKDLVEKYKNIFEKEGQNCRLLKFVPSSGAASRMFKDFFTYRNYLYSNHQNYAELPEYEKVNNFFTKLNEYALYEDLQKSMFNKNISLEICLQTKDYRSILDFLLTEKGLNYGHLPKALLCFHRSEKGCKTSLEEHLEESAAYATSKQKAYVHFTVSPEHLPLFKKKLEEVLPYYQKLYAKEYVIEFSIQKPCTDTLAVDMNNQLLRDAEGKLIFRPGGHGALIKNMDELNADIVFVKNIDNVCPENKRKDTILYKKALGGLLLDIRNQVFKALKTLDQAHCTEEDCTKIIDFINHEIGLRINLPQDFEQKKQYLKNLLNRPIRVCGMVKNEGEPGGGPFWVKNEDGYISLQIVESSQINLQEASQKEILQKATHFNPVDLVCSLTDYQGKSFSLENFVDSQTAFVSTKSVEGKDIKALELPGLWNGAMAHWITLFVEVPISIFTPVKTLFDLSRPEHRSSLKDS